MTYVTVMSFCGIVVMRCCYKVVDILVPIKYVHAGPFAVNLYTGVKIIIVQNNYIIWLQYIDIYSMYLVLQQ